MIERNDLMKKATIMIITCLLMLTRFIMISFPVHAEGESADISITLSRSVLNLGKSFTATIYVKPNINFNITSFDMVIGFDNTKLSVSEVNGVPKVDKTTKVPSGFLLQTNRDGDEIIVTGEDPTLQAPIALSGNTPVFVLTFTVRDNAGIGSSANFTVNSSKINMISGYDPIPLYPEYPSPKSAEIGPKLNTNTYLSKLIPSLGTLEPVFSKTVTKYSIDVTEDKDSITFDAAAEASKSNLKISGGSSLNFGANTVTITVTAEDPDFQRKYTITVNRASPPTPTPEDPTPTEEISEESSDDTSSVASEVSEVITPEPTPVSEPQDVREDQGPWKTATIILAVIAATSIGSTIWLAIDKARNRDKIVKIRRID